MLLTFFSCLSLSGAAAHPRGMERGAKKGEGSKRGAEEKR